MLLIVAQNKRTAESISDIFYYMGIISCAATPTEALGEISSIYKAVLISDPDSFADIKDFISRLTAYCTGIPLFSISENPSDISYRDLFIKNYHSDSYSSVLAKEIADELNSRGLPSIGSYKLAGIDASAGLAKVMSFDTPIPFTKTEAMILRYLISAYPMPQSAKSILKYAFKQNRCPDITGIRTHISVMNKKFRELRSRNVIVSIPERGYVIATPEILANII